MIRGSFSSVTSTTPVTTGSDVQGGMWPFDEHNVKLLDVVHPLKRANPVGLAIWCMI